MRKFVMIPKKKIMVVIILFLFIVFSYLLFGFYKTDNYSITQGNVNGLTAFDNSSEMITQVFSPKHMSLSGIGIYLERIDEITEDEICNIRIEGMLGKVYFEQTIPLHEAENKAYTTVNCNVRLVPFFRYKLKVFSEGVLAENTHFYYVVGEDIISENKKLYCGQEYMLGSALTVSYEYENTCDYAFFFPAIILLSISCLVPFLRFKNEKREWIVLGVLLLIAVSMQFFLYEWSLHEISKFFEDGNKAYLFNIGIIGISIMVFSVLLLRPGVAISIVSALVMLVYTIDFYVYRFRGRPFKLVDIKSAKTAFAVAKGYNFVPDKKLVICWLVSVFLIIAGIRLNRRVPVEKLLKSSVIHKKVLIEGIHFLGVILVCLFVLSIRFTDPFKLMGFPYDGGIRENLNYLYNGYLMSTWQCIANMTVKKPAGYSADEAQRILENYIGKTEISGEQPDIIVIMNESFTDLSLLENDNNSAIPAFKKLTSEARHGYLDVSVIGGGTANTEFEFFTGCSMNFLPDDYVPYEQCMTGEHFGMVSILKEHGYTTISMHPEDRYNYNRRNVYPGYGFDEMLWKDSFAGMETLHAGCKDSGTYEKIKEILENRKDEKLFIFDLTIQNHGPYDSSQEFDELMTSSDRDFAEFIEYIRAREKKTIVCMFGDHQPNLGTDYYIEHNVDNEIIKYRTPFIIWKNYEQGFDEEEIYTSPNFLGPMVLKEAGLSMSPYFHYLLELQQSVPSISAMGVWDRDGNYYSSGEDFENIGLVEQYWDIGYYYLFDNGDKKCYTFIP